MYKEGVERLQKFLYMTEKINNREVLNYVG